MTSQAFSPAPAAVDIAICGAGPVGMVMAALLVRRGYVPQDILLIDAKTLEQASQDPRSIALSHGSRQLLEQLDAWPTTATSIQDIHVSRRGHFGRTLIHANDYQLPALGYVSRYGDVVTALAASPLLRAVPTLRPSQLTAATEQTNGVTLELAELPSIHAQLLIQAEGGLFAEQNAKTLTRSYDQTAIVAHVQCSLPLPHRAFERFTAEGPLALLPQGAGYALVWCTRPDTAARLLSLPETAFLQTLQTTFGTRLGCFTVCSPRRGFPLGLNAEPVSSLRIIAIGNAAQTLHPVAGQGLNLGLRDATVLASLMSPASPISAATVTPSLLQRFAQARATDRRLTIRATDALARAFASGDGALSQTLLGAALGVLDVLPPARHALAEHMMYGYR